MSRYAFFEMVVLLLGRDLPFFRRALMFPTSEFLEAFFEEDFFVLVFLAVLLGDFPEVDARLVRLDPVVLFVAVVFLAIVLLI